MDQTDEFQFDQLFLVVADVRIGHLQAEIDQFDQLSTKSGEMWNNVRDADLRQRTTYKNLLWMISRIALEGTKERKGHSVAARITVVHFR